MIKKQAQIGYMPGTEPTTAPATKTTAPVAGGIGNFPGTELTTTTTTNKVISPSNKVFGGSPAIKEMQRAIIKLAQLVIAEMSFSNTPQGQHLERLLGLPVTRQDREAAGRANFGNFIAQNYLRNSDVDAVEYTIDPNKTNMSDKEPADPTRLSSVMDTMQRIGSSKSEFIADGKWGPRTNAALINIKAFAEGMLNLAKDCHINIPFDLNAFGTLPLDDKQISIIDKIKYAPLFTQKINATIRLFTQIKRDILHNQKFQSYIEGNAPLKTYQKNGLDQQTIDRLSKSFGQKLHVVLNKDGQQINQIITINDLLSPSALKEWQQTHAPNSSLQDILTSLKQTVAQMSGSLSSPGY